jgi:hypothetical protein
MGLAEDCRMTQGDHVRARRGGVWDHAIDVGDRTVVRYAAGAGIQRCEYADFVAGADEVEVVVHRERVYRPPLVVARAFSRFAESAFNSMFGSSEQFALWCKSGKLAPAGPAAPPRKAARAAARPRAGGAKPARRAPRKARPAARRARPAPKRKASGAGRARKGKRRTSRRGRRR